MINNTNKPTTTPTVLTKKDVNIVPVKKGTLVRLAKKIEQTIRLDVVLDEDTSVWMDVQYGKVSDTEIAAITREAEKLNYNPNHLLLARVIKKWSFVGTLEEINKAFCDYFIFAEMERYAKAKEQYENDLYHWDIEEAGISDDGAKAEFISKKPTPPSEIDEEVVAQYYYENLLIKEGSLELAEEKVEGEEEPLYHIPPKVETIASMFPTMGEENFVSKIWKQITARLNPTTLSGEKK
jgi:hypothetical protein